MLQIPLAAVPAQSLNVTLDQQNVSLSIYTLPRSSQSYSLGQPVQYDAPAALIQTIFMDVLLAGVPIRTCLQAVNLQRLLATAQYLGFVGDFVFVDTQGSADPIYSGLGSRFQLIYLEAADLAASILA